MIRKYYFINKFDTNNIDKQDKQTAIIYRNYSSKYMTNSILKLKDIVKKNQLNFIYQIILNLQLNLDLDGAYIPSFNKDTNILAYSYKKNFKLLDLHTILKKLRIKENQNVKKYFYLLYLKKIKIFRNK